MSDGRIEFDTSIDVKGVNKAGNLIRNSFKRIADQLDKVFSYDSGNLTRSVEETTQAFEEQQRKVEELCKALDELEEQRQTDLAAVPGLADAELRASPEGQALLGNAAEYEKALNEIIRVSNDAINKDYDEKAGKLTRQIADATDKMKKLDKRASKLGGSMRSAFATSVINNFRGALARVNGTLTGIFKKIGSLASRVLIFNVISQALKKIKDTMEGVFANDKKLQSLMQDIKSNLLTAFQPLYEYLLPILYKVLGVIRTITAVVAQFMATIFHKDVKQMQTNAKKLQEDLAEANKKTEKEKEKAVKKTAKTTEKAAKKVKKEIEKATLAGFDEINQLGENAEDAADAIEDIADAKEDIAETPEIPEFEEEETSATAGMFDTNFSELDAKTNLILTYGMMLAGVALLIVGIATLNFMMMLAGVGLIKAAKEYGMASGAFEEEPQWLTTIRKWGLVLAGAALLLIGLVTVNFFLMAQGIALIIAGIYIHDTTFPDEPSWLGKIIEWGKKLFPIGLLLFGISTLNIPAILIAIELIKAGAVQGKEDAYQTVGNKIKTFFLNVKQWIIDTANKAVELWTRITTTFSNVGAWFNQHVITPLRNMWNTYIAPIVNKIAEILSTIRQIIVAVVTLAWNWLSDKISTGIAWLREKIAPIAAFIKEKVITPVTNALTTFWGKVKEVVGNVAAWIGDKISGAIKWVINALFDYIEHKVNSFISIVNSVSSKLSKFGIDINPIEELHLPRLASGTVVPANYGEFAAILGDNKAETEVVSPLSTIKQALTEALRESGGGTSEITIYLSTAEVTKAIVNKVNGQTQSSGVCPIKLKA